MRGNSWSPRRTCVRSAKPGSTTSSTSCDTRKARGATRTGTARRRLRGRLRRPLAGSPSTDATPAGHVLLDAGTTRGTGIADLKYVLFDGKRFGTPVILGIQVQGDEFRLAAETCDKTKTGKVADSALATERRKEDMVRPRARPRRCDKRPKEGKRTFDRYDGTFFYRSKRLGAVSPQRLAEAIVAYVRLIRDNEAVLRRQVEDAL